MPKAHRNDDSRDARCGAKTVVVGQKSVFVNGKLWAVKDDINDHGGGELIPSGQSVTIAGKRVIVHKPDIAQIDGLGHVDDIDQTLEHSGSVSAYG